MSTSTGTLTLTDYQGYTSGAYMAYVAPWNKGSNVQGTDYSESIQLTSSLFPGNVVITSNWGSKATGSVFGFNGIDFGDYAGTKVQTPVASAQIKNIASLSETHNLTLGGATNGFDVIDDMFLTSGAGSTTAHKAEIEIFLHTPSYSSAYVQSVKQIGTFVGSGVTWTVAETSGSTPDILFMPSNKADVTSATIDIKAMFDYLVAHGVLTGNEYFNGMALGSETQTGNGTTTVNGFSVDYQPTASPVATASVATTSATVTSTKTLTAALLNDTGASATDRVTSDPTLTGTSAANAVVSFAEGQTVLGTTTADADGSWTYKPTGLADGAHTIAASAAGSTTSLGFTLETNAPTLTGGLGNDTGASATDAVTRDPLLTGHADANAVVTFMEGTRTLGSAIADAAGSWAFRPSGLAEGYHAIVGSETNAAGVTSKASFGFTLDTTAPSISASLTKAGSTGRAGVTRGAVIGGWTAQNATVTVVEDGRIVGATVAGANGAWSFAPGNISAGTHTFAATMDDAAGNAAAASMSLVSHRHRLR